MLLILLTIFVGGLIYAVIPEKTPSGRTCMGVRMLSESEMTGLGSYRYRDYSENLKFQNEYAAIDEETSVIYIPQNIDGATRAETLEGLLMIDTPGQELFFAPDVYWEDLSEAVRIGHKFKLLVSGWQNTYMQYDVVFTTLPVISMHGQLLYKDSEGRDVFSGRIVLWEPEEAKTTSTCVHWHIRGKSAGGQEKKPWKLSLKNWDGKNSRENLLGLGSDDDWILNAMNMEDSNVREKLFMDLWNEMVQQTDYNHSMSQGEYTEVLVNGEYTGLYLLQRRVDDRYLQLDQEQTLVKGLWNGTELGYEYISPVPSDEIMVERIDAFFFQDEVQILSIDNFIDTNLFLQFFCANDNRSYKNMYYLFSDREGGRVSFIPWDTDMAFGIQWDPLTDGFVYRYEENVNGSVERQEMNTMKQYYPDMKARLDARWKELREHIFSQSHIYDQLNKYLAVLDASGAPERDREKWGLYFEGEDRIDILYQFIEERLAVLDQYYSE